MADLLFVTLTVAFVGLALLVVRACDRIIGPDPDLQTGDDRAAGTTPGAVDPTAEEVEA